MWVRNGPRLVADAFVEVQPPPDHRIERVERRDECPDRDNHGERNVRSASFGNGIVITTRRPIANAIYVTQSGTSLKDTPLPRPRITA